MSRFATLTRQASELKRAGRLHDAIAVYRQALAVAPATGVAEHNLAAALGDAGAAAEAVSWCEAAIRRGLSAPETWLVLARAELACGRFDSAERAFRKVIQLRPAMVEAHYERAQLTWMRTGDQALALRGIDAAIRKLPTEPALRLVRARVLQYAGDEEGALAELERALERWPGDVALRIEAAYLGVLTQRATPAITHAMQALEHSPGHATAMLVLAYAFLAAGDPVRAVELADHLARRHPLDQEVLAVRATGWRLLGDERYEQFYDFDALVRPYEIATPHGWSSLSGYLDDLSAAMQRLHPYQSHPFGQSVRHGSQVSNVTRYDDPAVRAFPDAVAPIIDAHLEHMGMGEDPLRSRNCGGWQFQGIWSVRLSGGGFHASHVHPQGWISSACYIALPPAMGSAGENRERAGWLQFGAPGTPTQPVLDAQHFVAPVPGRLVLFPSYMWHGTVPFDAEHPRITIAFDVVPGTQAGAGLKSPNRARFPA